MKKQSIQFFGKIIVVLLLCFSGILNNSCTHDIPPPPPPYGFDYEIKGIVADEINAQPIQNIRVIKGSLLLGYPYKDTLYTDFEGKYSFKFLWSCPSYSNDETVFLLKIEDVDGEENSGYFETKEIEVAFTEVDWIKKEKKYVQIQNIELTKKEE